MIYISLHRAAKRPSIHEARGIMWPEIQFSETRIAAEHHTSAPYSLENSSRKIVVIYHFPSRSVVRLIKGGKQFICRSFILTKEIKKKNT